MKKVLLAALVVGAMALGGPRPALAQSGSAVVKIPFDFIVGDKLLPAGSYRLAPDTQDPLLLEITSTHDTVGTFAATGWTTNPNPMDPQAHVSFKNVDGHMFLWCVSVPGSAAREVTVTRSEAEQTLARLNLMPAERADTAK